MSTPHITNPNPLNLFPIIERHAQDLNKPGVATVRPGYVMKNDWPTKTPAIVVVKTPGAAAVDVPAEIEGIKVEVRDASPAEEMRVAQPERFRALAARKGEWRAGAFPELGEAAEAAIEVMAAKPHTDYTPADVPLAAVSGHLNFTCHASPDAGWPTLKHFLSQTQNTLTIGMYDFTAAHILSEVEAALAGGQKLKLTLDNPSLNPTADQSDPDTIKDLAENLGDSFDAAWALVRSNKLVPNWIFPTAYHIKVAVRDSKSVWLSSGNWNNSNQSDMDPINNPAATDQKTARKSDRDWHVVLDNTDLAETYEAFLRHDYKVASGIAPATGPGVLAALPEEEAPEFEIEAKAAEWKFFPPLVLQNEQATITPLLTPDPGIYRDAMLKLIQSAGEKLYIQLQYIHPSDKDEDADFSDLITAVVDRMNQGVDVRIITSQFQAMQGWLERLQAAGVDLDKVKLQNGVHNKGFVVDSKIVALGSQNWSGDGVLRNRDASVIIENAKAAAYYEKIFLYDWNNIARQSVK